MESTQKNTVSLAAPPAGGSAVPVRDPRDDPRRGDVVLAGPQWQIERYHVVGRVGPIVRYRYGPERPTQNCRIHEWRVWTASGEVLHVATEGTAHSPDGEGASNLSVLEAREGESA
jgi:hypothetical protein